MPVVCFIFYMFKTSLFEVLLDFSAKNRKMREKMSRLQPNKLLPKMSLFRCFPSFELTIFIGDFFNFTIAFAVMLFTGFALLMALESSRSYSHLRIS